jgi:hypothetical protein
MARRLVKLSALKGIEPLNPLFDLNAFWRILWSYYQAVIGVGYNPDPDKTVR